MLECGECGSEFKTRGRLMVGDVLECPECVTQLEVVDIDPLTMELSRAGNDSGDLFDDISARLEAPEDDGWLQ